MAHELSEVLLLLFCCLLGTGRKACVSRLTDGCQAWADRALQLLEQVVRLLAAVSPASCEAVYQSDELLVAAGLVFLLQL
eukprot:4676048-Heterocapsa_arctica.AAC.1